MKERPVLFSAPMVRAILDGRKTQTRRVVKGYVTCGCGESLSVCDRHGPMVTPTLAEVGDRLWVRETWAPLDETNKAHTPDGARAMYLADRSFFVEPARWRPSIHMPRWASRITLEATGVRVERLQAITEEDAKKEGARHFADIPDPHPYRQGPRWSCTEATSTDQCLGTPRMAFANLWESINGAGSWDANPWVWVVEFRRADSGPRPE